MDRKELINNRKASPLSKGEKIVSKYLKGKGIGFIREYWSLDLVNDRTGQLLFFDFFIQELNIAIEVDGSHHHKPINGKAEFESQVYRDCVKNKYCKEKGIKMLRLTYNDLKPPMDKLVGTIAGIKSVKNKKAKPTSKKKFKVRHRNIKGQHPEKKMKSLKSNIAIQEQELSRRRDEARLKYPSDIRIYLAEKISLGNG